MGAQRHKSIGPFSNHWQSVQELMRSASGACGSSPSYLNVKDCQSIEELMQIASDRIDELSPSTIGAVWSSIPRLISNSNRTHQAKHQITTIIRRTTNLLSRMRVKDLTTVILGMAKTVKNVREAKQKRRTNGYQQSFGDVFLDDNSNVQTSIFQPFAKRANDMLVDYDARCLSNHAYAYAYALLGFDPKFEDDSTLMGEIAIASIGCIEDFNPQGLSNAVWAYVTMNEKHSALFMKIGDAIVDLKDFNSFKPQDLAIIVWAFAKVNIQHPGLFEKIGNAIVELDDLKSFEPQHLSNVVWAYATANIQHPRLFKKVSDAIVELKDLKSFKPQYFSNIVWAYATANIQHPVLFEKVGDTIIELKDLKSFKPQELSNVVWAYATANIQHPDLFKKVGNAIVELKDLKSFKPQNLSNTVWAYATIDAQHPGLFKKVGDAIVELMDLKSFNSQNLANIAWAFAVSNADAHLLFNDAFIEVLTNRQSDFTNQDLSQFYQWHLWQTMENSQSGLPDSLREKCYQAFLAADTRSSVLQKDVVFELDSMGFSPIEEYTTTSGYKLDALIEMRGKKIAIEVDGPSHFINKQPNGRTAMKRRQVTSIDMISVMSVPYWEWNQLGKDQVKRQQYLQSLLGSM
jgi:hypothetical protein